MTINAKTIIEKAKAKSKRDPLTGAKIDKDRFILPEESDSDLEEARGSSYTLYHKSYTDAINHALDHHGKSGLKVSDDDRFHHVGIGSKKPSEGKTTSVNLPASHEKTGKKHMIHIQVYNKGGSHPYELNTYSSGAGRMHEEAEQLDERGADEKGYYRKTEDGAGLTRKGAKAMGVKTAVTTPPSKLDPNGKAAKRRKSFCARMGGMPGPMKDEKGRPTRKAMSLRRWNCRTEETQLDEVLGKDNEWGTPELRKKYAAMTPGQETLSSDKIPTFDPRYDDVATQYCGGIDVHENVEQLDEISALGAKKRSQFAAKLKKRLADPKVIAKAKKEVAKKKAAEKAAAAEAPKHLVMQLRKASSIGSKVRFYDGSEHHVAPNHVEKFNDRYHSLKSSIEKESLVKRAHTSHADFMRAISEETVHENCGTSDCCMQCDTAVPGLDGITPANYPTPQQVSPTPELGDYNGDGVENEWDEVAIEADVTNEIENSEFDDLEYYFDDDDYANEYEEHGELDEGLTPQGRIRKKFAAMRGKVRRNMAKNIQLKRIATPDRIKSRSVRAARNMVYKRLLRGRDRSTLSAGEKTRIEAQIKRMAPMVARLSVRLLQKERKRDQQRVVNIRTKKK